MLVYIPLIAANSFEDLINNVSTSLKAGDAKRLSASFDQTINLSVKREEGVYTKFQAEVLLSEFFRSNKVLTIKELQRVNSLANSFLVFSLKSNNSTYRVFFKIAQSDKEYRVTELRIE
ncbi:DUF4783 domain-containing protein [Sphingobacterium sp. LRF_L2]|uniref:DUF4783 domain-containing protein n=1 Tax=Sphingobacterium sp. LRF_L2 TaxID=3369421 RepID=UPI003F638F0A